MVVLLPSSALTAAREKNTDACTAIVRRIHKRQCAALTVQEQPDLALPILLSAIRLSLRSLAKSCGGIGRRIFERSSAQSSVMKVFPGGQKSFLHSRDRSCSSSADNSKFCSIRVRPSCGPWSIGGKTLSTQLQELGPLATLHRST